MKWLRERLSSLRLRVPAACAGDPMVEFADDGSAIRIVHGEQVLTLDLLRHAKLDVAREIERRNDRKYEDVP